MNTTCTHPTNYATDMTDAEWDIVAPYINHDPKIGSPRAVCMRCVMNALFYIDKTGGYPGICCLRIFRIMAPCITISASGQMTARLSA